MLLRRIVFLGTSDFSVPSLKLLSSSQYRPTLVISQPAKPQGRNLKLVSTPITQVAKELGLNCITPEDVNSEDVVSAISKLKPDLLITVSYGGFLKKRLREISLYGSINVHPSLLPKFRGATPIQSALWQGLEKTGISIFRLSGKMDAGAVYYQEEAPIYPFDSYSSLHDRLATLSAEMLVEFLYNHELNELQPITQNETTATYTSKLDKANCIINWDQSAIQISNQIRALAEEPGAESAFRGNYLKILRAKPLSEAVTGSSGTIGKLIKNIGFTVNASDYQLLILTVKPAGKKVMSAWNFHNGAQLVPNESMRI